MILKQTLIVPVTFELLLITEWSILISIFLDFIDFDCYHIPIKMKNVLFF